MVLTAVKKDWNVLQYANKGTRNDQDIILEVVQQNGIASCRLKIIKKSHYWPSRIIALQYKICHINLKKDKEIILIAVKNDILECYKTFEEIVEKRG